MRILSLCTIDDENEVLSLQKACGVRICCLQDTSLNADKTLPPYFECFADNELVAFLMLFLPTPDEVEVTAFTHPAWRRKGCFDLLLRQAKKEILAHGYHRILFDIEGESETGHEAVRHYPAIYSFSEFTMLLPSFPPVSSSTLSLVKATEMLYGQVDDEPMRDGDGRDTYVALCGETPVGCVALSPQGDKCWLYHVFIKPAYRGKGLGEALLRLAIEKASPLTPILEVDTKNIPALSLYRKLGFKETSPTTDYFSMEVSNG